MVFLDRFSPLVSDSNRRGGHTMESRTAAVVDAAIEPRENGAPPPHVALEDVDLGKLRILGSRRRSARRRIRHAAAGEPAVVSRRRRSSPDSSREPDIGRSPRSRTSTTPAAIRTSSVRARPAPRSVRSLPEISEFLGSMITLDDPRHLRLRTIVNRAFTPKVLARIEESVRDTARGAGDRHGGRASRRSGGLRRQRGRPAAAADHLRHDGHPGVRPRRTSSTGPRC